MNLCLMLKILIMQGSTNNASIEPYDSYFTHIVDTIQYDGESIQIDLPFNFKLNHYDINTDHTAQSIYNSPYIPDDMLLCGSNDKITYTSIARLQKASGDVIFGFDQDVINPVLYKYYKLIIISTQGRGLIGRIKFYGDIYA